MQATPNGHDSQYKKQCGLVKKDEVHVRIRKETLKGHKLVPNNATTMSEY